MTVALLYSLLLSVVLFIFWSAYHLLGLGKINAPALSRQALLSMTVVALGVAALPFVMPQPEPEIILMRPIEAEMADNAPVREMSATVPSTHIDWVRITDLIYIVGVVVSLTLLMMKMLRVLNIVRRTRKETTHLRLHNDSTLVPFTWGKWVVMSQADYATHGGMLHVHEVAHLHGAHWLDLLVINLVGCMTWYCPVARLIRRDLIEAHEYIADHAVLSHGYSAQEYQLLLIEKASGRRFANSIAPCINHSSLKKRIIMMLKPQPTASLRRRVLMLIPVAALAIAGATSLAALRPAPTSVVQIISDATPALYVAQVHESTSVEEPQKKEDEPQKKVETTDSVASTRIMPQYPGGEEALIKHVIMTMRYPQNAAINNIQGEVVCDFMVEKNGTISEIKVTHSVDTVLDAEAVRVIKTFPKFIPGTIDGKPERMWYTIPLTFKLQGSTQKKVVLEGVKTQNRDNAKTLSEQMQAHPDFEVWIDGEKATSAEAEALKSDDIKHILINCAGGFKRIEITTKM